MEQWIKSSEAARYAGVAVSTIKRWADDGVLECMRTTGGHRRYLVADLDKLVQREHGDTARWVSLLTTAPADEVDSALHQAHRRLGSWWAVAEQLGEVATQIGDMWRRGALSIAEEHRATERMRRGIASVCDRMVCAERAVAAVTCVPGEAHTLGLSLTELCLREAGYEVWWFGGALPAADVREVLEREDIRILAVSASLAASAPDLDAYVREIAQTAERCGVLLAFGGAGPWPSEPPGHRAVSWREFSKWAFRHMFDDDV